MKEAMKTALIFALVALLLAGLGMLWQHCRPQKQAEEVVETDPAAEAETAEISLRGATTITLEGSTAASVGSGVTVSGNAVTIGYPGVYTVSGSLDDGQLIVDLGDYNGTVYLVFDGASISCSAGPALYVKQATACVLMLQEGTENTLADGTDYWVDTGADLDAGAAVFSRDALIIRGEGSLTVLGNAADGIRGNDGVTVSGGTISVTAVGKALRGSDYVHIHGGDLSLTAGEDGIHTAQGDIELTDGYVAVTAQCDALSAVGDVRLEGGVLEASAADGPDNYSSVKIAEISAKGIKAQNIYVSGGVVSLNCADDAFHAENIEISGGYLAIRTGDDALSALDTVTLSDGEIVILKSYEAVEGDSVVISGGMITAKAEHNGLSGGDGSVFMTGGTVDITSEEALDAAGAKIYGGTLILRSEDISSLDSAAVTGGTLICLSDTECENTALHGALQYLFSEAVPAGTAITVAGDDNSLLLQTEAESDCTAVLVASGMLMPGGSYTLTAGDQSMTTVSGDGLTTSGELAQSRDFGGRP